MPGVVGEMKQTVTLLSHEPRVRFTAYFNKADEHNPESLFFTFPLAMEAAQAHFDTAGLPLAYDREQLPGACRDWFTAGSFVAVESKANPRAGCLTLACPDAPLFHVGGFHFARRRRDVSDANQALLMAWATNNYWDTNFRASQPGFLRFRFELARSDAYQPAESARFAESVARPVLFHPMVQTPAKPVGEMLISPMHESVNVVSMKPDGADSAIVVSLRNHSDAPVEVAPAFPGRRISGIAVLNAVEEPARTVAAGASVELPARRTTTLRIAFVPDTASVT
jgi:hypothetical protein